MQCYNISRNYLNLVTFSGKLFRCSACQYVYYCNQSCQQMSWPMHSKECARLKKFSPWGISNVARLMARIIIKLNQGGDEERGYYNETNYRKFKDLMSRKPLCYIRKRITIYIFLLD